MSQTTADLIIHPVRMRILQVLGNEILTTQEIAERLPDVPTSSVYRHLKVLLEAEFITIAATNLVKGIEEKTYRLARPPYIGPEDISTMSAEDHLRAFATYLLLVQQGFANYIQRALDNGAETLDFVADRAGYTEVTFYASDAEFDSLVGAINQAVVPLLHNAAGGDRRQRKLVTITHPLDG